MKLPFTNTSFIPNKEARLLVKWSYDFAFRAWQKKPEIKVRVTNTRAHFRGRAFGHKVLLRVGKKYPVNCKYPGLKTAPEYSVTNYRECLIMLAVHEFWHCAQIKLGHPTSEIECENRVVSALEYYRATGSDLNAKCDWVQNKLELKQAALKSAATPGAKLNGKLASTKLKKLNARRKLLLKKKEQPIIITA